MNPLPHPHARGRRRGPFDTLAAKTVILAIVAGCAMLLWCFAVPRAGEALDALRPPGPGVQQVDARVTSCPPDDTSAPCRISYGGRDPGEAQLVRVGLFDVAEGDELPVRVLEGQAVVTGWRPVVDAALLVALAAAFTGYAMGRWRVVLDHGNGPWDPDDRNDAADRPAAAEAEARRPGRTRPEHDRDLRA